MTFFVEDNVLLIYRKFQSNRDNIESRSKVENIDFSAIFELISLTNQWSINTSCWPIGMKFTTFIQLTMLYSMIWSKFVQVSENGCKLIGERSRRAFANIFEDLNNFFLHHWIEHCQLYKHDKFHSNRSTGSIDWSLICKTDQFKNGWKINIFDFLFAFYCPIALTFSMNMWDVVLYKSVGGFIPIWRFV